MLQMIIKTIDITCQINIIPVERFTNGRKELVSFYDMIKIPEKKTKAFPLNIIVILSVFMDHK